MDKASGSVTQPEHMYTRNMCIVRIIYINIHTYIYIYLRREGDESQLLRQRGALPGMAVFVVLGQGACWRVEYTLVGV